MRAKFIWKIWTRKKWEFRNPKHPLSISLNQWCSASSAYEQHTISTSSVHPQGKVVQRKKNVPFSLMINSHKSGNPNWTGIIHIISYHIRHFLFISAKILKICRSIYNRAIWRIVIELLWELTITLAPSLTGNSNFSTRLTGGLNTKGVFTSSKMRINAMQWKAHCVKRTSVGVADSIRTADRTKDEGARVTTRWKIERVKLISA